MTAVNRIRKLVLSVCFVAAHCLAQQPPFEVTVLDDFDEPWAIAFLPDARALITERNGRLLLWSSDGTRGEFSERPHLSELCRAWFALSQRCRSGPRAARSRCDAPAKRRSDLETGSEGHGARAFRSSHCVRFRRLSVDQFRGTTKVRSGTGYDGEPRQDPASER